MKQQHLNRSTHSVKGLGVVGGVLLLLVVPLLPFVPAGVLTTAGLPRQDCYKVFQKHLMGCGSGGASGATDAAAELV